MKSKTKIKKIKQIHQPVRLFSPAWDKEICIECKVKYPCKTIKIIKGTK